MLAPSRRRQLDATPPPESFLGAFGDLTAGLLFVFLAAVMALALAGRGQGSPVPPAAAGASRELAPTTPAGRRARVVSQIQAALARDGVEVFVDLEDGILRLPEKLLFDTGEAGFKPGGEATIKALARHLGRFLPGLPGLQAVVVEGHTDDQPIRTPYSDDLGLYKDNWDLSFQRAKHTYTAVLAAAPRLGKLQNARHEALLCIGAFGPSRPVGDNALPAGRLLNRRIDVRLIIEADDVHLPLARSTHG